MTDCNMKHDYTKNLYIKHLNIEILKNKLIKSFEMLINELFQKKFVLYWDIKVYVKIIFLVRMPLVSKYKPEVSFWYKF